jgi:molybdenum cofactor guanylyltransferase
MTIACVIFAGGQARRMDGRPKGLETVGGTTILERVVHGLVAPERPFFLSLSEQNRTMRLPQAFAAVDRIIDPGIGPAQALVRSLETVLANDRVEAVLTVSWDCPFLPDDLVVRLYSKLSSHNKTVVVASNGRRHPVIALWRRADAEIVQMAVAAGENRMHALLERVDAVNVEWPSQPFDPFFNVNTPEDLAMAQAIADRRVLNLSGLKCPLPVLRSRKALQSMAEGAMLDVIATDRMAAIDIPHFVRQDNHRLIGQLKTEKTLRFLIQCTSSHKKDGLG